MNFAKKFIIDDRLASLDNDVNRCLPVSGSKKESTGYAPFPALMYCFSIIDLLGAIYAGNARSHQTTENPSKYMKKYMKYPDDKISLLMKIYRHKIVHLSQPKGAMLYNGHIISWEHDENNPNTHLTIDPNQGDFPIFDYGVIHCHGKFIVSIWVLRDDIMDSVTRIPGGYYEDLQNDVDLRNKFVAAINQIFDPVITD
jgi:hypothetical protein